MSTEASPQQPTHLGQTYAQAAMSVGTAPNGGQPPAHLLGPDSGNRSYADSDAAASAPESPAVPPTKGKNGATGPAEGKPKPHVCPICQRGFTTGGHLQRHQRIHTGIKAFKCPYPGCETRTSRQDNLQQHYRTHLSPTLRRGSGTAARQAVAAAMMAAGLKSSTSRQPRKSKGSQVGTPGSSSGASGVHGQSPYQTPTQGTAPYGGYMYDPNQHGYPSYPPTMPPGVGGMTQPQSAQSSRVPSPVNGHSSQSGGVPSAHHQQYFSQPFSPAYAYPNSSYGQPYRYGQPGAVPSPYGPPSHHSIYSQGIAPEHGGQQHMYSPLQTGFAPHSRDSQYNVINPSGYASQAPMGNGYPPRTQTSTPLSNGTHEEVDPRYRGAAAPPRAPSPRRRLTPPHQAEMLASAGVVDTANFSTTAGHQAASRAPVSAAVPPQYSYNAAAAQQQQQQANGYNYGAHQQQQQSLAGRSAVTSMGGVVGGPDSKAFIKHE